MNSRNVDKRFVKILVIITLIKCYKGSIQKILPTGKLIPLPILFSTTFDSKATLLEQQSNRIMLFNFLNISCDGCGAPGSLNGKLYALPSLKMFRNLLFAQILELN